MSDMRPRNGDSRREAARATPPRGSLRAVAGTWLRRIERFFVPDQILPDGSVDDRAVQRQYRRAVGVVAVASLGDWCLSRSARRA